jgi:hypothetical protein
MWCVISIVCSYVNAYNHQCHHTHNTEHKNTLYGTQHPTRLTHLQQCKNPSPKHKKAKHLYNKENCKVETMLCNLKSPKVIWDHTRWDYVPWQISRTLFIGSRLTN